MNQPTYQTRPTGAIVVGDPNKFAWETAGRHPPPRGCRDWISEENHHFHGSHRSAPTTVAAPEDNIARTTPWKPKEGEALERLLVGDVVVGMAAEAVARVGRSRTRHPETWAWHPSSAEIWCPWETKNLGEAAQGETAGERRFWVLDPEDR